MNAFYDEWLPAGAAGVLEWPIIIINMLMPAYQ
jgi:hypothetical protein